MKETKCDFCGKVLTRDEGGKVSNILPNVRTKTDYVDIGVTTNIVKQSGENKDYGNYFGIEACLSCVQKFQKRMFDVGENVDAARLIHICDVLGLFREEPRRGWYITLGEESDRAKLLDMLEGFVANMADDAVELAMQIKGRMAKLTAEAQKKLLQKLDSFTLEKLEEAEDAE